MKPVLGAALAALFFVLTGSPQQAAAPPPVDLQMRNVALHLTADIVIDVRTLRGQMIPTSEKKPATLDDVGSFVARVDSGEIAISPRVLSDLLNNYVFAYPGAPLKKLVLTIEHGRIKQRGIMHKGVDLPFEAEGKLDIAPDGQLRFHADKVRSAHLPFKGLLHLFGEDLSKLIKVRADRGVTLEGDDILLNMSRMLPPPRIEGKATSVRLEADRIVQTFAANGLKPLALPAKAGNYIYYKGGVLRFGKLTMVDTDLEIVDQTPADPFDFSVPEYNRQLVAGFSRNTPSHGLIVTMPDFSSLQRRKPAPARTGGAATVN